MRDHRRLSVILAFAFATAFGPTAAAQEADGLAAALALESALTRVIEQAEESVVSIARVKVVRPPAGTAEFNPFQLELPGNHPLNESRRPTSPDFVPAEFGTGFIIAPERKRHERLILTNYHVVRGGPAVGQPAGQAEYQIYVRLTDRRGFDAQIVAADPRSDLAVLKIDYPSLGLKPADLKPLRTDYSGTFRKGQFVVALGNPYAIARDGSVSASWGMISNISRTPARLGGSYEGQASKSETIHHFGTLLQVDTRLNLGASGGPLLNLKGELIGISTSLAALEGYETSVGYAIPLDDATRRIIDSLTQGYEVEYGFLGVTPTDVAGEVLPPEVRQIQSSAARAEDVVPNSPAAAAGLQPHDIILAVDGQAVRNRHDLFRLIGQLGPETVSRLSIWRERVGEPLTLEVKLGKWPVVDEDGIIATNPRYREWRGLTVDYPTSRHRFMSFPPRYLPAVVVLKAPEADRFESGELRTGDYITHVRRTPVRTPAEFHEAIRGLTDDVPLRLLDGRQVVIRK